MVCYFLKTILGICVVGKFRPLVRSVPYGTNYSVQYIYDKRYHLIPSIFPMILILICHCFFWLSCARWNNIHTKSKWAKLRKPISLILSLSLPFKIICLVYTFSGNLEDIWDALFMFVFNFNSKYTSRTFRKIISLQSTLKSLLSAYWYITNMNVFYTQSLV